MNPHSLVNSQQNLISSLLTTSEDLQTSNHKLSKAHFADSLYLEELQAKSKNLTNELASKEEGSHMKERRILIQTEENLIFSKNINLLLHKMEKLILKEQRSTERINEEIGKRLELEKEHKVLMMRVNQLNLEKENVAGNLEREQLVFSEREQLFKSQIQKLHSQINLLTDENCGLRNEKEALKKENNSLASQLASVTHSLHSTSSILLSTQQTLSSQTHSYTQLASTSQASLQKMELTVQHLLSSEQTSSLLKHNMTEELRRVEEKVVCLSRRNQELEEKLHKAEEEEMRRRREEEELALLLEKIEIPQNFEGSSEIESFIRKNEEKGGYLRGNEAKNEGGQGYACNKKEEGGLNVDNGRIKPIVSVPSSPPGLLFEFVLVLRREYVRERMRALNAEQVLESLTESLDEKLKVLREKHEEWRGMAKAYSQLKEEESRREEEEGRRREEEGRRKVQLGELQRNNVEIKEQSKFLLKNLKGVFEENKRLRAALVMYDPDMAYGKWREGGGRVDGRRDDGRREDGREDGVARREEGGKMENGEWDIEEILVENWELRKLVKKLGEIQGREL